MPLQIQSAQVTGNQQITFSFSDTVTQQLVGISQFHLDYGYKNLWVEGVSISLETNRFGNHVTVIPTLSMYDVHGNTQLDASSSVTIVVMAWVGDENDYLTLTNAGCSHISNDGSSQQIPLQGNSPNIEFAALAGFNFNYGPNIDCQIQEMNVSVGSSNNADAGLVTATAQMYDRGGHTASATVDAGIVVSFDPSLDIAIVPTGPLAGSFDITTKCDTPYQYYQPILTGFNISYGNYDIDAIDAHLVCKGTKVRGSVGICAPDNTESSGSGYATGFVVCYNDPPASSTSAATSFATAAPPSYVITPKQK